MELTDENRTKKTQRYIAKGRLQDQCSAHFWIEHASCTLCGLQHQRAIIENACGMKDTVHSSIMLRGLRNHFPHLLKICNIALKNQYPPAIERISMSF